MVDDYVTRELLRLDPDSRWIERNGGKNNYGYYKHGTPTADCDAIKRAIDRLAATNRPIID